MFKNRLYQTILNHPYFLIANVDSFQNCENKHKITVFTTKD